MKKITCTAIFCLICVLYMQGQHRFSAKYKNGSVARVTNHPICQQEGFEIGNTNVNGDSIGVCYFDLTVRIQRPPDGIGPRSLVPAGLILNIWQNGQKIRQENFTDTLCLVEELASNQQYILTIEGPVPVYTNEDIARIVSISQNNIASGMYMKRASDADTSGGVDDNDILVIANFLMHQSVIIPKHYELIDEQNPPLTAFDSYTFPIIIYDDTKKDAIILVRGKSNY